MTQREVQLRAEAAAALMDNRAMREARQAVRDKVYNTWVGCTDLEEREKLHAIAVANEELWGALRGYIQTGDVNLANAEKLRTAPP